MIKHIIELIHCNYHCVPKGNRYILKESGHANSKSTGIPAKDNVLICQFDKDTKKLLPFFNSAVPGALMMADYIAFVEQGDCCFVYIIELSASAKKIRQRQAAEDFAEYIRNVAIRTSGISSISFCFRYIVVVDKFPPPRGLTAVGHAFDTHGKMVWKAGSELSLHMYSVQ